MTLSEARTALAAKLKIDIASVTAGQNDLFTIPDLTDLIQAGVQIAWDFKAWPFTLDALKTTWNGSDTYFDYPNTFADNSVYLMTVEGKPWGKREHTSYVAYLAENPTADDKIFSNFKRLLFANTNALSAGDEIVFYGKLRAPTLSADSDKLPFSPENDNDEDSGNRAIINLAYSEALASEKKNNPNQAEIERKKGFEQLSILWAPMGERNANEQPQSKPFFNVPDFFGKGHPKIGNF